MMVLPRLAALFAGNGLVIGLCVALGVMVLTWDRGRIKSAERRGGEVVRVETQKANDAAVKTSERVRAKSGSSGMRGTRDPHSID